MKSVLVVDSAESVVQLVNWGAKERFKVFDTNSVREAVLYLGVQHFDIIIIDASVSVEFVRQISGLGRFPNIIVMVAADQTALVNSLLGHPHIEFLFKPFDEASLTIRLERHNYRNIGHILAFDFSSHLDKKLQRYLQRKGFSLSMCPSDKHVEQVISQVQPTCILLDWNLPILNRTKLLKKIERFSLPIVLIANSTRMNELSADILQDFNDIVVAPVVPDELVFRLAAVHIENSDTILNSVPRDLPTSELNLPESNRDFPEKDVLSKLYVTLNHEIRSPLTSIIIGAQALLMRMEGGDNHHVLSEVVESAKKIRDTLDTLGVSRSIKVEEYVQGTQMARFEAPSTPTFHWI
ncbi:response regulator [bacterium]|nr:response regulator [bacterium]